MKLFESEKTFAFLDINPLSKGHAVRRRLTLSYEQGANRILRS